MSLNCLIFGTMPGSYLHHVRAMFSLTLPPYYLETWNFQDWVNILREHVYEVFIFQMMSTLFGPYWALFYWSFIFKLVSSLKCSRLSPLGPRGNSILLIVVETLYVCVCQFPHFVITYLCCISGWVTFWDLWSCWYRSRNNDNGKLFKVFWETEIWLRGL